MQWLWDRGQREAATRNKTEKNVYLHYTFDLWAEQRRRRHATGDIIIVRYADVSITGFQYWRDADRFLVDLRNRLASFSLSPHPDKTRLISSAGSPPTVAANGARANRKRSISWSSRTSVTVPGGMDPLSSGGG
jgi:hypothetical protein